MTDESGRGFSRLRIRSLPAKALYVIFGAFVLITMVAAVAGANSARTAFTTTPPGGFTSGDALIGVSAALVLWVLIGVRLFRDHGEPLAPPRFWWRFTGRPRAGFVIGAAFLVEAGALGIAAVLADDRQPLLVAAAVGALVGGAYLHSSLRLHS